MRALGPAIGTAAVKALLAMPKNAATNAANANLQSSTSWTVGGRSAPRARHINPTVDQARPASGRTEMA
jgi:hypothetical protein